MGNSNWLQAYTLLMFDKIDSTNLEAKRIAMAKAHGNYIITAKQQLNGLGSNNRKWESPDGNLYLSILLPMGAKSSRHPQLCFIAALAVYHTLETICQNSSAHKNHLINFKWPNDILLNQRKIAGILIETVQHNQENYIIIGVGLNIAHTPLLPERDERHFPATSLSDEEIKNGEQDITPDYMLNIIMTHFDRLYHKWLADSNFFFIRNFWLTHSVYLNQSVIIKNGDQVIEGVLRDLALDGALVIERNNQLEYIYSGSLFPSISHSQNES